MPTEEKARPPYVMFETRAVEDRDASLAAGSFCAKDVIFAVVTPAGSRDRMEKLAEDWLRDLKSAVNEDRFPGEWYDAYEKKFKMFQESQEIPEDGTPVSHWPVASPAQVKTLLGANVRTVEDLAIANEDAMMRIGMGARALKEKAVVWLESAGGQGKLANELESLRARVEAAEARTTELESQKKALESELGQKTKKQDA